MSLWSSRRTFSQTVLPGLAEPLKGQNQRCYTLNGGSSQLVQRETTMWSQSTHNSAQVGGEGDASAGFVLGAAAAAAAQRVPPNDAWGKRGT